MLKGNILIVDDEKEVCGAIRSLIKGAFPEVQVYTSDTLKKATEILRANLINVVITDMRMKFEEDGFKILRFIKTQKPLTQVIVLTVHPSVENVVKCMRVGCFDYLSKPDQNVFEKLLESTQKALELSNYPIDRESLTERLILSYWNEMEQTENPIQKGIALENFCSLLLQTIPGWQQIESRVKTDTEEIDLVILNESKEETWRKFGTLIIAECKNWARKGKPGRNEFDVFYQKIERRGKKDCRLGFFISINGVAKTFKAELQRIARADILIVVLEKNDLWGLVCAEDRSQFLKELTVKQIL